MFTCMNSRAVHIEVIHSLDTDSFIQALRQITAKRGNIRTIYSDNGSNFIRADNELKRAFEEMDNEKIKHSCTACCKPRWWCLRKTNTCSSKDFVFTVANSW